MKSRFECKDSSIGFTLVELLVTLAVISLVIAFVGPYTVQQVSRVERQSEVKQAQAWIEKKLFLSFITGTKSRLDLNKNTIKFTQAKTKTEKSEAEDGITDDISFDEIIFRQQSITISSYGIPSVLTFTIEMPQGAVNYQISARVPKYVNKAN